MNARPKRKVEQERSDKIVSDEYMGIKESDEAVDLAGEGLIQG